MSRRRLLTSSTVKRLWALLGSLTERRTFIFTHLRTVLGWTSNMLATSPTRQSYMAVSVGSPICRRRRSISSVVKRL